LPVPVDPGISGMKELNGYERHKGQRPDRNRTINAIVGQGTDKGIEIEMGGRLAI
jgi:hypothetical protein